MIPNFHAKRLSDAVHGTFGLSQVEADIISTAAFQRLHGVKQLGLAHLVYPDLNYSRFAHSVGACHLAGKMVRAINLNARDEVLNEKDWQLYRLAGLLHDLGHYPFSHTLEFAINNHYAKQLLGDDQKPAEPEGEEPHSFDHELLGRRIIEADSEIAEVLKKHEYTVDELKSVFSREQPGSLANLVSSDLDCDRLDYLMRTARHSGLPYGGVDVEYIINNTCVDDEGKLCISGKAARAVDHLLVSRYFDYTQIVFHKTVVGLEETLKDVIGGLLERGLIDFSAKRMMDRIRTGEIAALDDQYVMIEIRKARAALTNSEEDKILAVLIDALIRRRPPKLVAECEYIAGREKTDVKSHKNLLSQLEGGIDKWAAKFGIPSALWKVWGRHIKLTKVGSRVPIGVAMEHEDEFDDEAEQGVRILENPEKGGKSKLLVEYPFALMHNLADFNSYSARLYVHLENGSKIRAEIEQTIRKELKHFPFKW